MNGPSLLFLSLSVLSLLDAKDLKSQEHILTIPSDAQNVKTLQQMLSESSEEKGMEDMIEVPVEAAEFLEDVVNSLDLRAESQLDRMGKNEQLVQSPPDVVSRILPGSTSAISYSKVTSATPARLSLSPSSRLFGSPGETVQVQ